jgi:hypothetical protein
MRTIAGQLESFTFQSVAAGVNDPTFGSNVEDVFKQSWQNEIGSAPGSISAANIDGNEHLGAVFGGTQLLSNLSDNLVMPTGEPVVFEYSIDDVVNSLNVLWAVFNDISGRRIDDSGQFNAQGNTLFDDLSVSVDGDLWTTKISGTYKFEKYHITFHVPFSILISEEISIIRGTAPGSVSLMYRSLPLQLTADIDAIENAGVAVIVAIGILGGGPAEFANGINYLKTYISEKLSAAVSMLKENWPAIFPLQPVVGRIPQRTRLPGTTDNLWIKFNGISAPQGLVAQQVNGSIVATSQGQAIVFSGSQSPSRYRRVAFVMINGPARLTFYTANPALPAYKTGSDATRIYWAVVNDEVVNPKFQWSITDLHGRPTALATFRTLRQPFGHQNNSEAIEVTFLANEMLPGSSTVLVVHVSMDDDLHLKDVNGNLPKASLGVTILAQMVSVPHPTTNPILSPLSP